MTTTTSVLIKMGAIAKDEEFFYWKVRFLT